MPVSSVPLSDELVRPNRPSFTAANQTATGSAEC